MDYLLTFRVRGVLAGLVSSVVRRTSEIISMCICPFRDVLQGSNRGTLVVGVSVLPLQKLDWMFKQVATQDASGIVSVFTITE